MVQGEDQVAKDFQSSDETARFAEDLVAQDHDALSPEEQAAEHAVWNSPSLIALPSRFASRIVFCVI